MLIEKVFIHNVKNISTCYCHIYFRLQFQFTKIRKMYKKKKKKEDDSIAVITHATILFIQIIIENIHDPPGNTAKLVVYADDFSALSTVTELNVLW